MILVEGGQYNMGSSEDQSIFGYPHLVQLSDFTYRKPKLLTNFGKP